MRMLVLCAWAFGVGIILLAGLMAQEIFSESIFGVPQEPGAETGRGYMDEERSTSSSSTPIG